jgi:hypothetical protein
MDVAFIRNCWSRTLRCATRDEWQEFIPEQHEHASESCIECGQELWYMPESVDLASALQLEYCCTGCLVVRCKFAGSAVDGGWLDQIGSTRLDVPQHNLRSRREFQEATEVIIGDPALKQIDALQSEKRRREELERTQMPLRYENLSVKIYQYQGDQIRDHIQKTGMHKTAIIRQALKQYFDDQNAERKPTSET